MATAQLKRKDGAGLPAGVSGRSLVRWRSMLKFFDPVIKAFGISTDGIDLLETANGIHLRAVSAAGNFPFRVSPGSDADHVLVTDGTFHGLTPTIGGTALNHSPPPQLACVVGDDVYLCFTVTPTGADYDPDGAHDYHVTGGTVSDPIIIASASAPDGTDATYDGGAHAGTYYRRITTWTGATLNSQPIRHSLDASVCDGGGGTASVVLGEAG